MNGKTIVLTATLMGYLLGHDYDAFAQSVEPTTITQIVNDSTGDRAGNRGSSAALSGQRDIGSVHGGVIEFVPGAPMVKHRMGGVAGPPPQSCGDPNSGSCDISNGSAACDDLACCELICAINPFCCNVEWDQTCADAAIAKCDLTPTGACCDLGNCNILTEAECAAAGGLYNGDHTKCSYPGPATLYYSGAIGLAIPDNSPGGVSHTITITPAGGVPISDIDIVLDIAHTWVGDLCVTIEHLGTSVTAVQRIGDAALGCGAGGCCGCSGDNITGECNDEGGDGPITDACPPTGGSYIPDDALTAWDGMDLAGDWTITVQDNVSADTGTLNSWAVEHNEPGGTVCDYFAGACCRCPDKTCDIVEEADCAGPLDTWLGKGTDCGSDGGDVVTQGSSPGVAIPDGPSGVLSDDFEFSESFNMVDIDINLDIAHTWVGDVCVTISHLGTDVIVVQRIGDGTLGCDTGGCCGCGEDNILGSCNDEGSDGTINDACPPNGGDYEPENPLSAFDGMDSAGTWTITLVDNVTADTGTLNSWSVSAQQPGPGVCECEGGCGDGVLEGDELCDDGNNNDGDCCSSTCEWEASGSTCGDGATECSGQDTCDGVGNCDANDWGAETACGDGPTACSDQDTCNGNGGCTNENDLPNGTNCGAGATECSGHDFCSLGVCLPNDLASGTPCGSPVDECASAGNCSGGGVCNPGVVIVDCINDDGCCAVGCVNENDNDCPLDVPTVSDWGLLILALLLVAGSKVYFGRRRQTA